MSALSFTFQNARAQLDNGSKRAVDLVDECRKATHTQNDGLNAFLCTDFENAMRQAEVSDKRRLVGDVRSPLDGIPVAVKDNIVTRHFPTTAASKILQGYRSPFDATVVAGLSDAGAIVVGKTNLDGFGMGGSTENSAFGPSRNPFDPRRTPGGSSGGSAAVVAAGMVPLALGSDTGGSIRQPASYCGLVGLKPTYGSVSRYGLIAFASSFDTIGPFSHDAEGARQLLRILQRNDGRDSTQVRDQGPGARLDLNTGRPLDGVRIGLLRDWFTADLDDELRAALDATISTARDLGATVFDVDAPDARTAVAAYYVLTSAEAASNLSRYDGVRYGPRAAAVDVDSLYHNTRSLFGREEIRRIVLGTFVLSHGYYDAYVELAQRVRHTVLRRFVSTLETVDFLLGPTTAGPAFELGSKTSPVDMYKVDAFTVSANLAGLPAVSFPCGTHASLRLPLGAQLLGRPHDEERMLDVVDLFMRELSPNFHFHSSATVEQ